MQVTELVKVNGRPMIDVANDCILATPNDCFDDEATADEVIKFLIGVSNALGLELVTSMEAIEEE